MIVHPKLDLFECFMEARFRLLCSDRFGVFEFVVTVGQKPIEAFIRRHENVETRVF